MTRWLLLAAVALFADEGDYRRGIELAGLHRWEEAKQAFEAGLQKHPRDKRFLVELAGVHFRMGRRPEAKAYLKRALAIDPHDSYSNNFLGTLYLLDGNLEAALRYWNRIGKPIVEEIKLQPRPSLDPVLLDHAFAFSPASTLSRDDLLASQARLELLDIFSRFQFDLQPRPDEKFDLSFRSAERRGGKREQLISFLRGLPFQTVYPEFYDLGGAALNVTSLVRWDAQKRRVLGSISAPLARNPKWRYRLHFDGRKETWNVARIATEFRMERAEGGAEIQSSVNGSWSWRSGVRLSHRSFQGAPRSATFGDGFSLQYLGRVDHELLRIPERRFRIGSSASAEFGRTFAASLGSFSRAQGSVAFHWLPKACETSARFRAGKTFGHVPFDDLFMLGLERDNDLWLRGHIGTEHGKKGSAPLGSGFILANWELDRTVYENGFFQLQFGPFLDSGKINDGSGKWLWDAGVQCKLRLLGGVSLIFSYGKDLRSGRNAFYTMTVR